MVYQISYVPMFKLLLGLRRNDFEFNDLSLKSWHTFLQEIGDNTADNKLYNYGSLCIIQTERAIYSL